MSTITNPLTPAATNSISVQGLHPTEGREIGEPVLSGGSERIGFHCLDRIWSFLDPVDLSRTARTCRYAARRMRALDARSQSLFWATTARFVGHHFAPAIPDVSIKQTVLPMIGQANAQFRASLPNHPDTAFKGHQIQQLQQWIQKIHSGKCFKAVAERAITYYRVELLAVLLAQVEGPDGVNLCEEGDYGNPPHRTVASLLVHHTQIINQDTNTLQATRVNLILYRTMSRLDPIHLFRTVHNWVWEKVQWKDQRTPGNQFTNGKIQFELLKTMGLNIRIQARIFEERANRFSAPNNRTQAIAAYAELGFRPATEQFPPTLPDAIVDERETPGICFGLTFTVEKPNTATANSPIGTTMSRDSWKKMATATTGSVAGTTISRTTAAAQAKHQA